MHFVAFQQSGKPIEGNAGQFWTLAAVAFPATKWRTLQSRVHGLQKSFLRANYRPGASRIDANDLLHTRNAERAWSLAYSKGLERVVAALGVKLFIVVVDKSTTDKPAHANWLVPLAYQVIMRPILTFLRESSSLGALIIPEGRPEERKVIGELQFQHTVTSMAKTSPLVCSPIMQNEPESAGLQVADFVATCSKRYHETVYPKLFAKQILQGYDAVLNSHYQGFVKPNTYQSPFADARGFRQRGYAYLWRREGGPGGGLAGEELVNESSQQQHRERPYGGALKLLPTIQLPAGSPAAPQPGGENVAEESSSYRPRRPSTDSR